MRRPLIASLVVAVGMSLLPPAALAAGAAPAPTLSPPEGQWTTDGNDELTFGGTTEPGAELVEARLRRLDADGDCVCTDENGDPLTEDVTGRVAISDSGAISGSAFPGQTPDHATDFVLIVTVRNPDGSQASGTSDLLPIDRVHPEIVRYELVAPDEIHVVFSEEVVYRASAALSGAGSAWDWTVSLNGDDNLVTEVTGSGAERFLTLVEGFGQDDRPLVRFRTTVIERSYRDGSGEMVANDTAPRVSIDRIAPAAPTIETIAGVPGQSATSNDATPNVTVGGLTAGHSAELFRESDGIDGLSAGDHSFGRVFESDGTATFGVTAAEGHNALYAVALDNAVDGGGGPSPNRSDATTGTYLLDTVAPAAIGKASVVDGNQLRVTFSEIVFGANAASQWKIGNGAYPVERVSGSGATRLIRVRGVPAGTSVVYTPPPSGGYVDAVGNRLAGFTVVTDGAQPTPSTDPSIPPSQSSSPPPPSGSPGPTPSPSPTPSAPTSGSPSQDATLQVTAAQASTTAGTCQDIVVTIERDGAPAAGENVDVQLPGPLVPCNDGTARSSGADAVEHAEGYTDASGRITFGASATTSGRFDAMTWHDVDDDDEIDPGETYKRVTMTFRSAGERSLELSARREVRRGAKVRIHGRLVAVSAMCAGDQRVRVVTRSKDGKRVRYVTTDETGGFSLRHEVRRATRVRAFARKHGACQAARSKRLKIRIR